MTKKRLDDYIYLCGEIYDLRREKMRLERKLAEPVVDTVQGSSPEFPYTSHTIAISGTDEAVRKNLRRKIDTLNTTQAKLDKERQDIEEWLETIEKSKIRRLMRYRYIECYGWLKIAMILNFDSSDAARMAHNRYLEKNL